MRDCEPSGTRNRGDVVALRYVPSGRVRRAEPERIVEGSRSYIALCLAAGTSIKNPIDPADGMPIGRSLSYGERFAIDWKLADGLCRTARF